MDDVSATPSSKEVRDASDATDDAGPSSRELNTLLFALSLICLIAPGVSMALAGGDALPWLGAWPLQAAAPRGRFAARTGVLALGEVRAARALFCLKRELLWPRSAPPLSSSQPHPEPLT